MLIFVAVSLAMTRLNSVVAQVYLGCSKAWKHFDHFQCSSLVDCAPDAKCTLSLSLDECPDTEAEDFMKTKLHKEKVGLCNNYTLSSCDSCPGYTWCIEYTTYSEEDIENGCTAECPTTWLEGQGPDRCYGPKEGG
jgi:hypothetical protein